MYFFIYKTINLINNKYYIGAHKTKNLDDNYLGSGIALRRAIIKYGKSNFKRHILFMCKSENDMYLLEKSIITKDLIENVECYNMTRGGIGSFSHIDSSGDNNVMRNNIDVKNKVILSAKLTRKKNKSYYDAISINNLKQAISNNTGKKRPEHSLIMKDHMKQQWANNKEKYRDALSSTFKIISPIGEEYETNRLKEFSKIHNLGYTSLWRSSISGYSPKKGKSKDWICIKVK